MTKYTNKKTVTLTEQEVKRFFDNRDPMDWLAVT